MLNKYSKKSDRNLVILAKLGNQGLKEAYIVERRTGIPSKFKVPKIKEPCIPLLKNARRIK
jgi:hypothetical protein